MPHRIPPLRQLFAFEAAARHQSFKKAAEELHVTQAAVSHQVRALEEQLGRQLFHRKTRQVLLTEAAKPLAQRLSGAFEEIASAVEALQERSLDGPLTLSVAPFYGNRMLMPRLARFRAAFPQIRLDIQMMGKVVDLNVDPIDAAIRYGTGDWTGLTVLPLTKDRLGPVAAPRIARDLSLPVAPETLATLPLAINEGAQEDWRNWFRAVDYDNSDDITMIEYSDRARAIDLALSGNGVALADTRLVARDEADGHLVRLHPQVIPSRKNMYLVFAKTDYPDPKVMAFYDWFRAELGDQSS